MHVLLKGAITVVLSERIVERVKMVRRTLCYYNFYFKYYQSARSGAKYTAPRIIVLWSWKLKGSDLEANCDLLPDLLQIDVDKNTSEYMGA